MTTLVTTRQPLQVLSMSNQSERRSSKRLAAAAEYERDDDFQFVRKSKRVKTDEPESTLAPVPEPTSAKKPGRGRPATKERVTKTTRASANITVPIPAEPVEPAPKPTTKRKSTRRKLSVDASTEEPEAKMPKRATRKSTRAAEVNVEKEQVQAESEPQLEPQLELEPQPQQEPQTNGTSRKNGRRKEPAPASTEEPAPVPIARSKSKKKPVEEKSSPHKEVSVEFAKIALPMSDTPVINRNKEMRKKGGNSNRRSSLGMRGRRASSLIESGQTAIPHREVNPADFYKHIEADGLTEPRRMKQLLTWCGERALAAKPRYGTPNSNAILGARAIQDQLLTDFSSRSEFSDWFSRDEDVPKVPVVLKPNPRNIELDQKMTELEAKIKRLQVEKKAWMAIKKTPIEQPVLFTEDEKNGIVLPDFDLLDPDEGRIRGYLADETASFEAIRSRTESRLRTIQSCLEFQVDQLADNIHKLEQRVLVAGKEADKVLSVSALRLRQQEEREKKSIGTKDMPVMEVLRSLGSILPEGGG